MNNLTPKCSYCAEWSKLVTGKEIYPHRPDLYKLNFYLCKPCNAYVGTHKGTLKPLGKLATAELRQAKSAAHRAFDPLWKQTSMSRANDYKFLAERLEIEAADCHIGMFDLETCKKVVTIMTGCYL